MLLNSHISAYATCLAGEVCGVVRSTWGTSQGEDILGARDKISITKVARWANARAGQTFPICAFQWMQSSSSWEVAVVHRVSLPKVPPQQPSNLMPQLDCHLSQCLGRETEAGAL